MSEPENYVQLSQHSGFNFDVFISKLMGNKTIYVILLTDKLLEATDDGIVFSNRQSV